MKKNAAYWIERLGMREHPEGGYFVEHYRATESIAQTCLPQRFKDERAFSTAIYFLLQAGDFSAFHRVQSDELWHFYAGDGVELHMIDQQGEAHRLLLGDDFDNGFHFSRVIAAKAWQAAVVIEGGQFALVGCTVAPGFDFADFELAERAALAAAYPQHRVLVEKFTRAK